jgi:asparagine synthase (glutamine-hydrolysing)
MCGIAGIVWRVHLHRERAMAGAHARMTQWLDSLERGIAHRGPDGKGKHFTRFVDGEHAWHVGLVHRRLAIIDAAGGHQPMTARHADGTQSTIVFNGCIDNHRALRKELSQHGAAFESDHSDTEALVHAWHAYKSNVCEKLEGMHAFAVVDDAARDVFLSQDASLEKPLWWGRLRSSESEGQAQDVLAFASVPAALARLQRVVEGRVRVAQPEALMQWLWLGASDAPVLSCAQPLKARGLVVSARELLAQGERAVQRAREESGGQIAEGRGDEDTTPEAVRDVIERAVAMRLESDVPVGCFLSGGVDSSLIAAFARRHTRELHTFTVRMPDARYDESAYAQAAAEHLGTTHHELACEQSPAETVQDLIASLGAPLADSSLLPAHWVAKAAAAQVKVVLSGDGGDELFAGYERHIAAMHLARMGGLLGAWPTPDVATLHPKSLRSKLARLIHAARSDYFDARAIYSRDQLRRLVPESGRVQFAEAPAWNGLDPCSHDFEHALADDLLLKADHASMRVGIESRAPLLARAVTKLALRAPLASLTSPSGQSSSLRELWPQRKALLRTVAREFLPSWIVDRPKMGFAIPVGEWLRTDAGLRSVLQESVQNPDWLDADVLGFEVNRKEAARMAREHERGNEHHDQRLYALVVLGVWVQWVKAVGRS